MFERSNLGSVLFDHLFAISEMIVPLLIIALTLETLALLSFFIERSRNKYDLSLILQYLRAVIRKDRGLAISRPKHGDHLQILRLIELVLGQVSNAEQQVRQHEELLDRSTDLIASSDQVDSAATELNHLLVRELAPYAIASAVLLRDSNSGDIRICNIIGVPEKRVTACLLMLFDQQSGEDVWGITSSKYGAIFDLSALEIFSHLMWPIQSNGELIGAVWVGMRGTFLSLTGEEQNKLNSIVKHGAASLAASTKVNKLIENSKKERTFLLGVSHDLKSPGNCALYALRDVLSEERGPLNAEQRLNLDIVQSAISEQLSTISDVLDMARYEHGFLSAQPGKIDLRSVLNEVIAGHRILAQSKGIALDVVLDSYPPILFDPTHFRRIFNNLISNSIKYSNGGKIETRVSMDNDTAYIRIIDSGIGIPEDQVSKLFVEYGRMSNVGRRAGVGLGLAISQVLAKLNNATLSYEANKPHGSIFCVSLPRMQQNTSCDGNLSSSGSQTGLCGTISNSEALVLIIEDDAAVGRSYIRQLSALELRFLTASDISQAIGLIKSEEPDLIISDLHLADTEPNELLAELNSLASSTPKLFISGSSSPSLIDLISKTPLARILDKPVERQILQDTVRDILTKGEGLS